MNHQKIKVLAVDDEESFTRLLKLNLERHQRYEVCCENNSSHAVDAAHDFVPDVILMDIVMPGLDGGDLVNRIHSDPILKEVPVIMVTALIDNRESQGEVVTTPDGQEMLGKPFRMSTLCNCIDSHIDASLEFAC